MPPKGQASKRRRPVRGGTKAKSKSRRTTNRAPARAKSASDRGGGGGGIPHRVLSRLLAAKPAPVAAAAAAAAGAVAGEDEDEDEDESKDPDFKPPEEGGEDEDEDLDDDDGEEEEDGDDDADVDLDADASGSADPAAGAGAGAGADEPPARVPERAQTFQDPVLVNCTSVVARIWGSSQALCDAPDGTPPPPNIVQAGDVVCLQYLDEDFDPPRQKNGYLRVHRLREHKTRGIVMDGHWVYEFKDVQDALLSEPGHDPEIIREYLAERNFEDGDVALSDHRAVQPLSCVQWLCPEIKPQWLWAANPHKGNKLELVRLQQQFLRGDTVQMRVDEDEEERKERQRLEPELCVFRDFCSSEPEMMWATTYGRNLHPIIQQNLRFGYAGEEGAFVRRTLMDPRKNDAPTGRKFDILHIHDPLRVVRGHCAVCRCVRPLTVRLIPPRPGVGDPVDVKEFTIGSDCSARIVHAQKILDQVHAVRQWYRSLSGSLQSTADTFELMRHEHAKLEAMKELVGQSVGEKDEAERAAFASSTDVSDLVGGGGGGGSDGEDL